MLKNIIKVLTSNGIVAVVGLMSSLFLPNILTVDDYALYQTFILYVSYVSFFHLGFPNGLSIKYAGVHFCNIEKKQLKSEMRLLLLLISFFTIFIGCFSYRNKSIMIFCVAIMLFCSCYLATVTQLLQAWEKFNIYAFAHIMISAMPLLMPLIVYLLLRRSSGSISIFLYVASYVVTTIFFLIWHWKLAHKYESNKIFSRENLEIEKIGILFHLGSYINIIFHNIDKQFVKWFCSIYEFSYYSFAITMQSSMTIFLTAVSQPLFPYIASGNLDRKEKYTFVKRFLLMLGSLSGVAYFLCSFIVENFLLKYVNSLLVIKIYFAVFPAMAIINCLYFNLYKVRKLKYRYVIDLFSMLILAIVFNVGVVIVGDGYLGVAIVTVLIYYVWMFYGTTIFQELKFKKEEIIFVGFFLLIFILLPNFIDNIAGAIVFLVLDYIICKICFPKETQYVQSFFIKKVKRLVLR